MTKWNALNSDPEFRALLNLSAVLGADPLRVQGAGGNTSIKRGGAMWIKASGTWLAEALTRPIMTRVRLAPLLSALACGDPAAEKATAFVDTTLNSVGLRPSIETCLHALLAADVVVHVHCVDTIALAVRLDGEARIGERLRPLNDVAWIHVHYVRPGLPLAQALGAQLKSATNVIMLGNHGLVVAGASVDETADRLRRVCAAFGAAPRPAPSPDLARLSRLVEGAGYRLPVDPGCARRRRRGRSARLSASRGARRAAAALDPDCRRRGQ